MREKDFFETQQPDKASMASKPATVTFEEVPAETAGIPQNTVTAAEAAPIIKEEPILTFDTENAAALYTLWFGLDYGSILTAYALYKTVETMGKKPYLIEKPAALWSAHYADKENIAGKFIYQYCDVIPAATNASAKAALEAIDTHITGSDVIWDCKVVGEQVGKYFYLEDVTRETDTRIAYASSLGINYDISGDKRNDYQILLHKFAGVSVKSFEESLKISDYYYILPEIVLDPVFLCDKSNYLACANASVAKEVEKESSFIFTYIKNGNQRKRSFIQSGNSILLETCYSPLRNFIDINRYPESKAALGLEPAYHILVQDWLHYLIHSDFVITDDYYGMCFALLFEKNFVVVLDRGTKDSSRYTTLLEQLGLTERLLFTDEDFKRKLYLFRKPVRYQVVTEKLEELRKSSYAWLKSMLDKQNG